MILAKTILEISQKIAQEKFAGKKVAFVPTMGALHSGHLALVKKAQELADIVVVSLFVNKTQFNDLTDYQKYPRQLESDLAQLQVQNVDYVFAPDEAEIYPQNPSFKIVVTDFVDCLCGKERQGHFDGVALIITKLFNIVKPDLAIFGEKDFQQIMVIKKLVRDFNFPVEIFSHEILRESSGLAMSSRNQRLSDSAKIIAANIFRILLEIKSEIILAHKLSSQNLFSQNEEESREKAVSILDESSSNISKEIKTKNSDKKIIENILQNKQKELLNLGFEKIDYLEIRDEKNLQSVSNLDQMVGARIFIAAFLENVRLIDNLKI